MKELLALNFRDMYVFILYKIGNIVLIAMLVLMFYELVTWTLDENKYTNYEVQEETSHGSVKIINCYLHINFRIYRRKF